MGGSPNSWRPTLDEIVRRDTLAELRGSVTEVEHRFFLALLLNVPSRDDILSLVSQRYPGAPIDTIMRWAEELSETSDSGTWILDAEFPEELAIPMEKQSESSSRLSVTSWRTRRAAILSLRLFVGQPTSSGCATPSQAPV